MTDKERIERLEKQVLTLGNHLIEFGVMLKSTTSNLNEVQKNLIKVVKVVTNTIAVKWKHPQGGPLS